MFHSSVGWTQPNFLKSFIKVIACDGWTAAWANRAQDQSRSETGRGGLCVYNIDAWRSNAAEAKLLVRRCRRPFHHHLVDSVYIQPRARERSWAARISAPRLRGCSLLRSIAIPYSSAQRPLSAHLKISFAPRSLKFKRGSNSWRCTYMTCLLAFRNILQTPSLNEWPPWRHTWELERNGTIALAFVLKPALRSDYISHAPLPARSAHMPWFNPTQTTQDALRVYVCSYVTNWRYVLCNEGVYQLSFSQDLKMTVFMKA